MQSFTIINENLIFKQATVLFSFCVPNNENKYLLYYVTDLDNGAKKLLISRLVDNEDYVYIKDIKDKRFNNIKIYIDSFINGNSGKKEIKINRDKINLEPNICQVITEKDRDVMCKNIEDIEWALNNIKDENIDGYIYIKELNDIVYKLIKSRNEDISKEIEKENIRGNVNIFLLTLFAVIFLGVLLVMGYREFINH